MNDTLNEAVDQLLEEQQTQEAPDLDLGQLTELAGRTGNPATGLGWEDAVREVKRRLEHRLNGTSVLMSGPDGRPVAVFKRDRRSPSGYSVRFADNTVPGQGFVGVIGGADTSDPNSRAARRRALRAAKQLKGR